MSDSSPATVPVAIRVDRAAAILAGRAAYGTQVVQVDLTSLAQEDRASLADAASEGSLPIGDVSDAIDLNGVGKYLIGGGYPDYPVLSEATVDGVLSVLAVRRLCRSVHEERQAAQAAKADAEWARTEAAWLAEPDDQLIARDRYDMWKARPVENFGNRAVSSEAKARFERLAEKARLRNEEFRAAADEAGRLRQAEAAKAFARAGEIREAEAARRAARLEEIVATLCSDEQRRRHTARLLPEEEMLAAYRDDVFMPLAPFRRYERITGAEVAAAGDPEGHGDEIVFETSDAEKAEAGEFATFEAIRDVADKALPPGTAVKLLVHRGGWQASEDWAVSRTSVKVTVEADGITVSREFASP